jgi:Arc/MetJ family transcription regulator
MIKSAAIIKTKALAPWKELRLQKRKLKKAQLAERKATKQVRPSPMGRRVVEVPELVMPEVVEVIETSEDESPATREEMLQQAEAIGLKVDKRWSDATLLKHIEELEWATQNDNS